MVARRFACKRKQAPAARLSAEPPRRERSPPVGTLGHRMYYMDCNLLRLWPMGRSTTSIRLDDDLRLQLGAQAAAEGATVTELIERFVRDGLASAAHPGIVFKPGPAGRRAALAGGADVWEVVAALRNSGGSESKRVAVVAEQLGLHERQVVVALEYAAAHRAEIEARVAAND
jgi:uncharacterized protein (DUF433 family)